MTKCKTPKEFATRRTRSWPTYKSKLRRSFDREPLPNTNKFEPSSYELYQLVEYRCQQKEKFKKKRIDRETFTLEQILRTDANDANWDFSVIARSSIGDSTTCFHWEELVQFYFCVSTHKFTPHDVELLDDDHHKCDTATERSVYFAEQCKNTLLHHKQQTGNDGFIFTLDGRLRNVDALLAAGISNDRILVGEMNPRVCLFEKLLAQHPSRNVKVYYTGKSGFQTFFLTSQDDYVVENLCGGYFDFCGDLPDNLKATLQTMPSLKLYGTTQAVRNCDEKLVQLKGFKRIREFNPNKVRCSFFKSDQK